MERRLGAQERRILDELDSKGRAIISLMAGTASETASLKRAVRSLERKGLVGTTIDRFNGRDHLIVITVEEAQRRREQDRRSRLAAARLRLSLAEREIRELERLVDGEE
ncbi:hypothetical protein [Bifidobacterium aerophilum]|uniref:MarR family transcriptional regulator n=1 Tax=Bifidobacterium aerophilum TaxID=1798155 RepID=A0A6N9Z7D1_9BIFI|nr:hypothetical protein [Bifidobacterium aerophilum]NEG90597.1 hypothetical protein [Bifidobacterium aerophilum]